MASIKRRDDGHYRARYRDESGREHARHFTRRVDAQRWLDEVTAAVVTGQYVDPKAGRVTFKTYYAQWAKRQVWVPGTVLAMDLAARSVTFGEVPLARLRRSHIEQWVKTMQTNKLAPGTIKTRFVNVRSVLRAAVRDRVIAADPSNDVALPRQRRREATMVIPTSEQVGALLRASEKPFKPFVALCAFAGLRLGEAAAVKVEDVDFLRRTLSVRRQVQRAKAGQVEIRAPKYGSERDVYLADELVTFLARHVEEFSGRPWLFKGDNDHPPHQNTIGYWWRKACTKAKLEGFTCHDLRHFYASGLIAAGCDVVTVQRALGHAKATTTLNTYAHLWPTAEDKTRKAAGQLMADALADSLRTSDAV